jgi:hypothetical protein
LIHDQLLNINQVLTPLHQTPLLTPHEKQNTRIQTIILALPQPLPSLPEISLLISTIVVVPTTLAVTVCVAVLKIVTTFEPSCAEGVTVVVEVELTVVIERTFGSG